MALSFFFLFQVLCETFILNAVLVIAKNKLSYPAPFFFSKVFQGALFLFFISGDWWVWCFCAIDPCLSFAFQRDVTVVFSTIFILVISGKKKQKTQNNSPTFHPISMTAGLHSTWQRPGHPPLCLLAVCIPTICLVERRQ